MNLPTTSSNSVSFFCYKSSFFFLNFDGFFILNKINLAQIEFCKQEKSFLFVLQKSSNVSSLFFFKLILYGVGLRFWSFFDSYNSQQVLIIKLGFSKDIFIVIPHSINIFVIKNNLLIIKSFSKLEGSSFASFLKKQRVSSKFKLKGIYFSKENVPLFTVRKKK